jgi:hypothetical protein
MALKDESLEVRVSRMEGEVEGIKNLTVQVFQELRSLREEMNKRFALFEQKLVEMGVKFEQKFDHLERKLDQKTDRVFWWVISLLTALCMALFFKR